MTNAQNPAYVLACAGTFLALCPIFVALRFYGRSLKKNGFGIDDYLVLPALLLVVGCAVVLIIGVNHQVLGYPTPEFDFDAPDYNFTTMQQLQWAFFLMQIPAIGLIKLSFLFLFRKLFITGHGRTFDYFSRAFIALVAAWTLAFFFWEMFSCGVPVSNRWRIADTYLEFCATDNMQNYSLAISDFITDAITLLIPIPLVFRLQLTAKRKILVLVAFSFGAIAIAASAIRLALFVEIVAISNGTDHTDADPNLLTTQGLYWSMLESGLGLIACCLPAINHVLRVASVSTFVRSARSAYPLSSIRRSGGDSSGGRSRRADFDSISALQSGTNEDGEGKAGSRHSGDIESRTSASSAGRLKEQNYSVSVTPMS